MADFDTLTAGSGLATPTSSRSNSGNIKFSLDDADLQYDNPFLDMTSTYLPTSLKKIFKLIGSFLFGDSLINTIITRMSEYPITKLVYEDWETSIKTDREPEEIWRLILEECIDIRRQLIIAGSNYHGYGNSYISVHFPFKRNITCPECKTKKNITSIKGLKYSNKHYKGKCTSCGYDGNLDFEDIITKDYRGVNIIHWDILHVDVVFNNITGDSFYYYDIPEVMKKAVSSGNMDIINSTPKEVLTAINANKRLKLNRDNLFHLKRDNISYLVPSERGYGIPAVMPVLKNVVHNQILKKGNEMIAMEYIVPLRMLYPLQQGEVSPHISMDLGLWRTKVEEAIHAWRKDKNKVLLIPQPVGVHLLGGNAKSLSVSSEIQMVENDIIIGMGTIPEIIKGGASWSGSNVSLRVVENSYLNYRTDMQNVLNFIKKKISAQYSIPDIRVKFSEFKMADDMQRKQMILSAASGSPSDAVISKHTAVKEMGYDPDIEYERRQSELDDMVQLRIAESKGNAKATGEARIIDAIFAAEADMENQNRREIGERKKYEQQMKMNEKRQRENADYINQEVNTLAGQSGITSESVSIPDLIMRLTERFAVMSKVAPDEFTMRMMSMKASTPTLFEEVYNNLREKNLIEADLIPNLAMAQDKTPGEIPQYVQGDQTATDAPTQVESFASPGVAGDEAAAISKNNTAAAKPNPEVMPPRRKNPSI